jgi:hypothetical protein
LQQEGGVPGTALKLVAKYGGSDHRPMTDKEVRQQAFDKVPRIERRRKDRNPVCLDFSQWLKGGKFSARQCFSGKSGSDGMKGPPSGNWGPSILFRNLPFYLKTFARNAQITKKPAKIVV